MTELQRNSTNAVRIAPYPFGEKDVDFVLDNLREIDRYELAACGMNPEHAIDHIRMSADAFLVSLNGEPVFVVGTIERMPGVKTFFGFGTDKTTRIMPTFTRFCQRLWFPHLFKDGMRRGQAQLPIDCVKNWSWLIDLGFTPEAIMKRYGANGETFIQLALFEECLQR